MGACGGGELCSAEVHTHHTSLLHARLATRYRALGAEGGAERGRGRGGRGSGVGGGRERERRGEGRGEGEGKGDVVKERRREEGNGE